MARAAQYEQVDKRFGERHSQLQPDEGRPFVGRKPHECWQWLTVERASCLVAWALGCCGEASARRFWQALPKGY